MKTLLVLLLLVSASAEAFAPFVVKSTGKRSNFMMYSGYRLNAPASIEIDNFSLRTQADGNLVLYKLDPFSVMWSANTWNGGCPTCRFEFQADGHLVVRDDGGWKWSSNTASAAGGRVEFRNIYPYLCIYDAAGNWVWANW